MIELVLVGLSVSLLSQAMPLFVFTRIDGEVRMQPLEEAPPAPRVDQARALLATSDDDRRWEQHAALLLVTHALLCPEE